MDFGSTGSPNESVLVDVSLRETNVGSNLQAPLLGSEHRVTVQQDDLIAPAPVQQDGVVALAPVRGWARLLIDTAAATASVVVIELLKATAIESVRHFLNSPVGKAVEVGVAVTTFLIAETSIAARDREQARVAYQRTEMSAAWIRNPVQQQGYDAEPAQYSPGS